MEIRNLGGCWTVIRLGAVSLSVWRERAAAGEPLGSGVLGLFRVFRGSMAAEHATTEEKA
jgi:hypothetical protein